MNAKKFYFTLIVLLLLSFVAIVGAYTWGHGQLEQKSAAVSDLQADKDVTQEAIIKLQKASADAEDVDSVVAVLDRLLPKEKQQEKLIADIIYTATAEAGIPFSKVASFSFEGGSEPDALSGTKASKANPGVFEYPFDITVNSISYETLLKLLEEIETNGRIVQVENIGITPETDSANVNVNLSMKAYVKP